MNYNKLMARTFARRADKSTQLAFALIAGIAAGAVMAVLFAPKSGKDVRKGITDGVMGLGQGAKDIYASLRSKINGENAEHTRNGAMQDQENGYGNRAAVKKPKSDIKDLIHEAHANGTHTEQSL
jgi:gas vesicle protein